MQRKKSTEEPRGEMLPQEWLWIREVTGKENVDSWNEIIPVLFFTVVLQQEHLTGKISLVSLCLSPLHRCQSNKFQIEFTDAPKNKQGS